MIRFRNPACDLRGMIKIFSVVYEQLKERETFGISDMTQAIISANLMSSSGYTGKRAMEQGNSAARRLDKTYNNSKMFSEWFRLLGWITAVSTTVLEFRFTWLGMHAAAMADHPDALLEECLLGINNPNAVLRVKYTEPVRFFRCLLRTMLRLDGRLCRDEMILGPMCVDDRSETSVFTMLDRLYAIRGDRNALDMAFQSLCEELHMKEISVRNCTRFPISALRHCGWAEEYYDQTIYPGHSMKFFRLTDYGKLRAEALESIFDLRLSEFVLQTPAVQNALIRQGFYQMMARSGFDTTSYRITAQAEADQRLCMPILNGQPLYFSPYQTIDADQVDAALGVKQRFIKEEWFDLFAFMDTARSVTALPWKEPMQRPIPPLFVNFSKVQDTKYWDATAVSVATELITMLREGRKPREIADVMLDRYRQANQALFYPLVASLFQILGYRCQISRQGDNAERWDAVLLDERASVPIEIKSPMEELHLSLKAVRQALENKIVLLSRGTHPTTPDCTTLAVGFLPPNARADVATLIADIKITYGISIAVVDFGSLIELAALALQNNAVPETGLIQKWEGIIHGNHLVTTKSKYGNSTP